jgi:hypothetical protein
MKNQITIDHSIRLNVSKYIHDHSVVTREADLANKVSEIRSGERATKTRFHKRKPAKKIRHSNNGGQANSQDAWNARTQGKSASSAQSLVGFGDDDLAPTVIPPARGI